MNIWIYSQTKQKVESIGNISTDSIEISGATPYLEVVQPIPELPVKKQPSEVRYLKRF